VVRVEDIVHSHVFNPDHYIGIVIANTTLLYNYIYFVVEYHNVMLGGSSVYVKGMGE
jgi:hypothetical protein